MSSPFSSQSHEKRDASARPTRVYIHQLQPTTNSDKLSEEVYPKAKKIRLVPDNLNTHDGASLYEAFSPQKARRLLDKIAFHSTPKYGSWLNMAETEIGMMNRQCLNDRLDNQNTLATQVAVWESKRHAKNARIHWTFPLAVARQKLRKLYPSIED